MKIQSLKANQIKKMKDFILKFPTLLDSPTLLKINKTISFLSFIIQELFAYLVLKSNDGTYLFEIREMKKNYEDNKIRLEILNNNNLKR